MAEARAVRDARFGTRVTYSPKVFIPLTMLCRDKCGYCTFAQPPARLDSPYLDPEQVLAIARAGARAGCHEALFTLGERPEERYPVGREWLAEHGYDSTVDYLAAMAELVLDEIGLLPHANAGALFPDELAALRPVVAVAGDDDRVAQRRPRLPPRLARQDPGAPAGHARGGRRAGHPVHHRHPRRHRRVPRRPHRRARGHRRLAPPPRPRAGGDRPELPAQAGHGDAPAPPCPPDDYLDAIALARLILPADVHLQAPPNLSDDFGVLLDAGIDDWGGVSPVTADHVNPERPWPALDRLREVTEEPRLRAGAAAHDLPRVRARSRAAGSTTALRFPVLDRSDAEGLGRDDPGAVFAQRIAPAQPRAGRRRRRGAAHRPAQHGLVLGRRSADPPTLRARPTGRAGGAVAEVLDGVLLGQELGVDEIVTLFAARGPEVAAVAEVADDLRRRTVGDVVTYVRNRNINYTNVCTFKCRFCGFSKGPLSLNLRGTPVPAHPRRHRRARASRPSSSGATEVCLQGGIHPTSTATTTSTSPGR